MSGVTKLFVGNIARGSNPDELKQRFESYGTVVEFDILADYGFVHFSTPSEAEAALELNGKSFSGQNLKVEKSTSYVRQKPGGAKVNNDSCYVCGSTGHWAKNCPDVPEHERDKQTRRVMRAQMDRRNNRYDDYYDYPPPPPRRMWSPPPRRYYDDLDDYEYELYYRRRFAPPRYYDPYDDLDYLPPPRRPPPPGYYRREPHPYDDYSPPRRPLPPRYHPDSMYDRKRPDGPPGTPPNGADYDREKQPDSLVPFERLPVYDGERARDGDRRPAGNGMYRDRAPGLIDPAASLPADSAAAAPKPTTPFYMDFASDAVSAAAATPTTQMGAAVSTPSRSESFPGPDRRFDGGPDRRFDGGPDRRFDGGPDRRFDGGPGALLDLERPPTNYYDNRFAGPPAPVPRPY